MQNFPNHLNNTSFPPLNAKSAAYQNSQLGHNNPHNNQQQTWGWQNSWSQIVQHPPKEVKQNDWGWTSEGCHTHNQMHSLPFNHPLQGIDFWYSNVESCNPPTHAYQHYENQNLHVFHPVFPPPSDHFQYNQYERLMPHPWNTIPMPPSATLPLPPSPKTLPMPPFSSPTPTPSLENSFHRNSTMVEKKVLPSSNKNDCDADADGSKSIETSLSKPSTVVIKYNYNFFPFLERDEKKSDDFKTCLELFRILGLSGIKAIFSDIPENILKAVLVHEFQMKNKVGIH